MARPPSPARAERARISGVDVVRSDPNLRSIKVAGRVVAKLTAAEVDRLGLRPGLPWTAARAAAVDRCARASRSRAAALDMLARRALSSIEVRDRLMLKGFAAELAEQTVRDLVRDRWIDDRAVACQIVESAQRKGPISRASLREKLSQRGIADDLAAEAVTQASNDVELEGQAMDMARRLAAHNARGGPQAVARRVASALARRGFDTDLIERSLRNAGLMADID